MTIRLGMISPSGKTGTVNSDNMQEALNNGYKFNIPQKRLGMISPSGKTGTVSIDNMQEALNNGFKLQTEANFSDKVQSFAQGVSGAVGGIGDFAVGGAEKLAGYLLPNVPTNTGNEGMEQAFSPIASMKQGLSDAGSKIWEEKPLEHLQRQGVGAVAGAIGGENAQKYITEDTGLEHIQAIRFLKHNSWLMLLAIIILIYKRHNIIEKIRASKILNIHYYIIPKVGKFFYISGLIVIFLLISATLITDTILGIKFIMLSIILFYVIIPSIKKSL